MGLLGVEQKKGDPEQLDGRLTVYAIVDIDPTEMVNTTHPVASMVHNGLLVAQGNYKEQNSLKDFLRSEMGVSMEEGLSEFLERLDGLEGALDPEKLKEKMENFEEIQDIIPTPAKIVVFHSVDEVLEQDGDVFCAGSFKNMANANLGVNSFPIMYQARYREQEIERVKKEIERLVSQVEGSEMPDLHYTTPGLDVEEKILKDYIPGMLYARKDEAVFPATVERFRQFLTGYQFAEDTDCIIRMISNTETLAKRDHVLLELYAKKIVEVVRENFTEVREVSRKIAEMEGDVSSH